MSAIKKFIEFVFGFLLCLSLFLILLSNTAYQLTSINTVKSIFKEFIMQSPEVSNSTIEFYTSMKRVCETQPSMEFNDVNIGPVTLTIRCIEVLSMNYEEFISSIVDRVSNSFYYTTPSCQIIECLRQGGSNALLALFNERSHQMFSDIFSFSILISILIALVLIYLTDKYWKLRTIGICFSSVGLIGFIAINSTYNYLTQHVLIGRPEILNIIAEILSPTINNFFIFLIIGIFLIFISYLLQFIKERKVRKEKIEKVKVEEKKPEIREKRIEKKGKVRKRK